MLEIKLLSLFALCLVTIAAAGFCAVRFSDEHRGSLLIGFMLTADTEKLEDTVRSTVYPIAVSFPGAELLVLDTGASAEALQIFERLMERSCAYVII